MVKSQPKLTVDAVVFDGQGHLLLIKRRSTPFKNCYALPGGFVEFGETVDRLLFQQPFDARIAVEGEEGGKLRRREVVGGNHGRQPSP